MSYSKRVNHKEFGICKYANHNLHLDFKTHFCRCSKTVKYVSKLCVFTVAVYLSMFVFCFLMFLVFSVN